MPEGFCGVLQKEKPAKAISSGQPGGETAGAQQPKDPLAVPVNASPRVAAAMLKAKEYKERKSGASTSAAVPAASGVTRCASATASCPPFLPNLLCSLPPDWGGVWLVTNPGIFVGQFGLIDARIHVQRKGRGGIPKGILLYCCIHKSSEHVGPQPGFQNGHPLPSPPLSSPLLCSSSLPFISYLLFSFLFFSMSSAAVPQLQADVSSCGPGLTQRSKLRS